MGCARGVQIEEEEETFTSLQNFRSFVHSLNKMGRCLWGAGVKGSNS